MDHMGEENEKRREYSRVDAHIPFEYRIIAREEKDHVVARMYDDYPFSDVRPLPEVGDRDHILDEWLKIMNTKLDTIIRLITLQREGYFGLSFKAVNISGGGMSFFVPQAISLGEILEIKIMLAFHQPIALCIYGEVVKSEQREERHFIAVHYVHMDDSIRDEIIRFVFEREREIIREKKR